MQKQTIILGIDPGSRITGYGIIRVENKKIHYFSCDKHYKKLLKEAINYPKSFHAANFTLNFNLFSIIFRYSS